MWVALIETKNRDHITPALAALHWLPLTSRITLRILLLTYKALIGDAPSCLKELVVPYCPTRELRSLNAGLLVVPTVQTDLANNFPLSFKCTSHILIAPIVLHGPDLEMLLEAERLRGTLRIH